MSDQEQTEIRKKGLAKMSEVYGWEMADGPGLHFGHTAAQLFAEVWTREELSNRDRRLLLLGLLAGNGHTDVAEIQAGKWELLPELLAYALQDARVEADVYLRMTNQLPDQLGA